MSLSGVNIAFGVIPVISDVTISSHLVLNSYSLQVLALKVPWRLSVAFSAVSEQIAAFFFFK